MGVLHLYTVDVRWTGAGETGTTSYTAYSRDHEVRVEGRPVLLGSSDPAFRGDPTRYTPEELFVAALSQCHMLWFLHLAAADGVVVVEYRDEAVGRMRVESAGAGQFTEVMLHPRVTVRSPSPATGGTAAGTVSDGTSSPGAGAARPDPAADHPRAGAARPDAAVTDARVAALHLRAHEHCFIARSVNFPVRHEPVTRRVA